MLTALVIGDPHFKLDNVTEMIEFSDKLLERARQLAPTFIVCLGDVLHTHDRISMIPLVKAIAFLDELRKIAPLYLLIGNHDRLGQAVFLTAEHPFTSLKSWANTYVVDKVFEDTIMGHKFMFVPYVAPGRFQEALKTILPAVTLSEVTLNDTERLESHLKDVTAIFAHQEFRNAKMGPIISTTGDEWPASWPYIISGHIHDYDELAVNILYVGTPLQHAFNENSDKTVSVFTWGRERASVTDRREAEGLPTSEETSMLIIPQHTRIDLGLTKKKIIHITCSELMNYTPPTGYLLKVVVTGTSAEIKAAMKLTNVKTMIGNGVKVVYKDIPATVTPSQSSAPITGPVNTVKFSQRLYSAMTRDAELIAIYERLFGVMNMSIPLHVTVKTAVPPAPSRPSIKLNIAM